MSTRTKKRLLACFCSAFTLFTLFTGCHAAPQSAAKKSSGVSATAGTPAAEKKAKTSLSTDASGSAADSKAAGTSGSARSAATAPTTTSVKTPCIITTRYATEQPIVADVIAAAPRYEIDPAGKEDSTYAIQEALYDCSHEGGGTVYLPAGKYRITDQLTIPDFVTLRGDWQDPDVGNSYGTILLMDIPATTPEDNSGTITIGGSAGVMGLTVYYPHQSAAGVKPYPFTFYITGQGNGYMLQSVCNCTLINAYKGIGACVAEDNAHEMLTVDTVKGTVLYRGAVAYNQADVGTWKNVTFSGKYWANAGAGLARASLSSIEAYTKAHGIGLQLGDLEWTQFENIQLSGYETGASIVKGKRIEFAGCFYGLQVSNCKTALHIQSMDDRWGMVIANSALSGSSRALVNETAGMVKLAGVRTAGSVSGNVTNDPTALPSCNLSSPKLAKKPSRLTVVSGDKLAAKDISGALQAALTRMGQQGGGIVYLPAGNYRLDKPVTVPAKVELRGSSSVAQRDASGLSGGTLILSYATRQSSAAAADKATALITLAGQDSGISGVRFVYPDNLKALTNSTCSPYAYTIRGKAAGVYALNVCISAGWNGIDFRGCDGHLVRKLVSCCFENAMVLGGKNGMAEGCLQNGTCVSRLHGDDHVTPLSEGLLFSNVFNPITRRQTDYIRLDPTAKGERLVNNFAYGVKSLIVSDHASDTIAVNMGSDNLGDTTPQISVSGGSLTGINLMRYNGTSYVSKSAAVTLINRLTIGNAKEPTVCVKG